jgi:CheY-like chemotaxis protein
VVVLSAGSPDGGEVLAALRADRELSHVPVVAVGLASWTSALVAAGCDAVLARPLAEGALVKALGDVLATSGAARSSGR